jgi:hypothetical protein
MSVAPGDSPKERASDSPFVRYIEWGFASGEGDRVFPADCHWYLFVQRYNGETRLGISGPMTKVLSVPHPAEIECLGIRFATGIFMPHLSNTHLVDNVMFLPEASDKSFWLNASAWEFPTFENAETFVSRLVREGVLVCDPVINSVLHDQPQAMSHSTIRRRFLRATGLTPGTIRQIERARKAEILLKQGASILDTVHEAGYFDQPHLTRSLKHFIGRTPAQIARMTQSA